MLVLSGMDGELAAKGVLRDLLDVVVEIGADDPLEEIGRVRGDLAERFAVVPSERHDGLAVAPFEAAVLVDVAGVDRIAERVEFVEGLRERGNRFRELVGYRQYFPYKRIPAR